MIKNGIKRPITREIMNTGESKCVFKSYRFNFNKKVRYEATAGGISKDVEKDGWKKCKQIKVCRLQIGRVTGEVEGAKEWTDHQCNKGWAGKISL